MKHPRMLDIGSICMYLTIDQVNTVLQMCDDIEDEWSRLNDDEKDIKAYFTTKKEEYERRMKDANRET